MAEKRKDKNGYVLRRGECVRADGRYSYSYVDNEKKRHVVYAKNIVELREKEKEILRDRDDGIDAGMARRMTLNDLYDRYISQKFNLKETTLAGYIYYYNSYVRDTFGQRRIVDIKYSDIKKFYYSLMKDRGLAATSVEHVHTQLHPAFALAVREDIIRKFQLGYAPDRGNQLTKHLQKQGFQETYITNNVDTKLGTGLIGKAENGEFFDRFRDRVIFPIHTVSGKTVAFAGRILKKK